MRVAIMGRGRLGGSLEFLLRAAGQEVVGWSRGEALPSADVYWLCVPDRAIPEVAAMLPSGAIALHSAGSLGPEALLPLEQGAVLHPLMTFPGIQRGIPDLRGVPATLAGEGPAREAAAELGSILGLKVMSIQGDRRRYHAAATIASSHVAAVFLSAARLLEELGLTPQEAREALLPLALESLRKAADGPAALTGPTARGDRGTEEGHIQALHPQEVRNYVMIRALILKLREERTDGSAQPDEVAIVGTSTDAIF